MVVTNNTNAIMHVHSTLLISNGHIATRQHKPFAVETTVCTTVEHHLSWWLAVSHLELSYHKWPLVCHCHQKMVAGQGIMILV